MRKLITILSLIAVFSTALLIQTPEAFSQGATPVRVKYATTAVTTTVYVQLVASTVKGIKGLSVVNSGPNPVEIAIGSVGHELVQVVAPGTTATSTVEPVYYPASSGFGTRYSAITLDGTNSTGELEVNLLYN